MTTHPVLCLIGGYPNDSDAGVDADDAGTASPEQVCPWPECDDPVSPCAELCFPGFR